MGSKNFCPRLLKSGSRIGLVAPAGPLLEADDIRRGAELCRALGWEPTVMPHAADRHGYLAGRDDDRLADLNAALADPELDAVWCLRGGYGITRLLDRVDLAAAATSRKVVIGFSDITALLNAITQSTGLITFHGPVARNGLTDFSRRHFERVLTRGAAPGLLEAPPPPAGQLVPREPRVVTIAGGRTEGRLMGGNLTLLQCLIGTPYQPNLHGALLLIEEVGEALYRIDRCLSHLRLAGLLDGLAGVIVGRITELERRSSDGALGLEEVLTDYLAPLGVPVAFGLPFGHVDDQWTLPIGGRARFDADAGTVELLDPAVA